MSETRFVVRDTIGANRPAAIVIHHGDQKITLDGVTPEMLSGIAKVFKRASRQAQEYLGDISGDHGPSEFILSYSVEWGDETFDGALYDRPQNIP